jgi:hypothetical protein
MAVNVVAQVFVQFLSIWFPPKNSRAKLVQQRAPISIFIFSSFPEKEKKQTTGEGKKKGKFKIFGCGSDASAQYLGIKQFTTSLAKIRKNPNQKIDVQNKTKTRKCASGALLLLFCNEKFCFFLKTKEKIPIVKKRKKKSTVNGTRIDLGNILKDIEPVPVGNTCRLFFSFLSF